MLPDIEAVAASTFLFPVLPGRISKLLLDVPCQLILPLGVALSANWDNRLLSCSE